MEIPEFRVKKIPSAEQTDRIINSIETVFYPKATTAAKILNKTIVTIVPSATVDFSK